MPDRLHQLELLAPARDITVGMAAISHGADAVYIGGPGFGARSSAGNSLEDIERLASYAHRFHAKVFMALNTLIYDNEFEDAVKLAHRAYEAGVDALILQDMGLLKAELPPIEIHASTQCDIRTPQKAAMLDALGFAQVVLARELTLDEIKACRMAMPRARIEFFVHGALCVSYSGRCYLSCSQCGRSANRGACAQPCRLPYDVFDAFGREIAHRKHVLSLKDNDQSANLEQLIAAGVSSFKIEGRLKDVDYVKNITAYYRKKIDAFLESDAGANYVASSLGHTEFSFTPDPAKTFHRSKTDYFVNGRQKVIANLDTPKSTGEVIGTVVAINRKTPQSIDIATKIAIANGDGLTYLDDAEELKGLNVNRAEVVSKGKTRIFLHEPLIRHAGLKVGAVLTRNKDRLFAKMLEGKTSTRTMDVDLKLVVGDDALSLLATEVQTQTCVAAEIPFVASPAKDAGKVISGIETALRQTGDTDFKVVDIDFDFGAVTSPFIPVSVLKKLRREVLEQLSNEISANHVRFGRLEAQKFDSPYRDQKPEKLDFTLNCANAKARDFFKDLGIELPPAAFEIAGQTIDLTHAELMRCRHCIRHTLGLCPKTVKGSPDAKEAFKKANGGHLKPLPLLLIDDKGERLVARFDCRACEMTISKAPADWPEGEL
ncbi:MAG: U32 family peptidase [Sutterellaceae bacterium]|nr:U32 family peptidase [Sutterellaceae bacterium]